MKIGVIVLSHGNFAQQMVETAFAIVGKKEGVEGVSVGGEVSLDSVCEKVRQKISQMNMDYVVILTDMVGGTPCNSSLMLCANNKNIYVVSGVNLYMLITAINNRDNASSIEEYVEKLISSGKNSIVDVKEKFVKKLNSIK